MKHPSTDLDMFERKKVKYSLLLLAIGLSFIGGVEFQQAKDCHITSIKEINENPTHYSNEKVCVRGMVSESVSNDPVDDMPLLGVALRDSAWNKLKVTSDSLHLFSSISSLPEGASVEIQGDIQLEEQTQIELVSTKEIKASIIANKVILLSSGH